MKPTWVQAVEAFMAGSKTKWCKPRVLSLAIYEPGSDHKVSDGTPSGYQDVHIVIRVYG